MTNCVSSITTQDVIDFIRLDDVDSSEREQIETFIEIAKSYIQSETGIEDLDSQIEFVQVVLLLCQDMYDNRYSVSDSNKTMNPIVENILGHHRRNLL